MIFSLDVDTVLLASISNSEAEKLFSTLIDTDLLGYHLVAISRKNCEWAERTLSLSGQHRAHLERIRQRNTTISGLLSSARVKADIVVGNHPLDFNAENSKYVLGHRKLLTGRFCESPSILVLENGDQDGKFYSDIFQKVVRLLNLPHVEFDVVHGGGSSTHVVFESEIKKPKIVVCIVDSDKKAPCDSPSETCKKVMDMQSKYRTILFGRAFETVGAEAENVVSLQVLEQMKGYSEPIGMEHIRNNTNFSIPIEAHDCLWQYFDVKEGLNGEKLSKQLATKIITESTVNWLMKKLDISKEEFESLVIGGFGGSIINSVIDHGPSQETLHSLVRSPYWRNLYEQFMLDVLWYFCANTRTRV